MNEPRDEQDIQESTDRAGSEGREASAPPQPVALAYLEPPRPERIPHMGHVGLLGLLIAVGLAGAALLTAVAVQVHLFGVARFKDTVGDVRYALLSQAALEVIPFLLALILFPPLWNQDFFAAIEWNGRTAMRRIGRLVLASFGCLSLALANMFLMPSPADAPIDKMVRAPGAVWLLFAFGVTFAPFFEEFAFRGFLLPALCTASDWIAERFLGTDPLPLDPGGHPRWSLGAMIAGSIATSIPFALMHAQQTGHALGPLLLLVGVSLVLCATRLATRSLAASVVVHACYNFLLFSLMLVGTGGFRHLDQM